jgi:Fe-S cluster assembly protein SufD
MSALADARDRLLALQAGLAAERRGEPVWLARLRAEARECFAEQGLPDTRQEEWRYTSLAALARQRFERSAPGARLSRADLEGVAFPVFACSLSAFVDGAFDPKLSALEPGRDVHVESLAHALARGEPALEGRLGRLADTKRHPLAALNTACFEDGAFLRVPRGACAGEPLHVVFAATGGEASVRHPRLLVLAEPGSRACVILDFVSLAGAAGLTNSVAEVWVGPGAGVDLVILQREAEGAFHLANLAVWQERDSRFACHTLSFGGRLVRNDAEVVLAGEGADGELRGLFVGGGEQVLDNHTLIDHAVPHGTSRELYKGILGGSARGVFRGRVIVRPDAQKTSASQSNRNLLLSETAEVDSKPQLEIRADDVRCSHGSTIGQLDPDALFYLRSRGIAEAEARALLTRGFAAEILAALPVPALAEGLDAALDAGLVRAAGREAAR